MKAIAFDLDGTLLNKKGEVTPKTLLVLNKLLEEGVLLIVCTGRSYEAAKKVIDKIGLEGKNAYFCGMNGQKIVSFKDQTIIEKGMLSSEEISKLCAYIQKKNVLAILQDKKEMVIVYDQGKKWLSYLFILISKIIWIYRQNDIFEDKKRCSLNHLPKAQYAKVCFTGLPSDLKNLKEELNRLNPDLYQLSFVAKHWLECYLKEINKGEAISTIAKLENIDLKDMMAFGDGENDIAMFKVVGKSIAMQNAMLNVKEAADDVCLSHERDGVASYLLENYFNQK